MCLKIFNLDKVVRQQKTLKSSIHNSNVIWKYINKSFKMGSICSAAIWSKDGKSGELIQKDGLIDGVSSYEF
jgi:hypothetical protein